MTLPSSTMLGESPLPLLMRLKRASLAGETFSRGETIPESVRSRHHRSGRATLGLGYLQATLAALNGVVTTICLQPDGRHGSVLARSSGGGEKTYVFDWRQSDDALVMGGFETGPTYQAALVSLVQLVATHVIGGPSTQTAEVVGRYTTLLQRMDTAFPRPSRNVPWTADVIARACETPIIRDQLFAVADALYFATTYTLSTELSPQHVSVVPNLAPAEAAWEERLDGSVLLQPIGPRAVIIKAPAEDAASGGEAAPKPGRPKAEPATAGRMRSTKKRGAGPADEPVAAVDSESMPPAAAPLEIDGTHVERVVGVLTRGRRRLMLVGPTGTGKTTVATYAATTLGYGIELIQIDDGVDARALVGSYRRGGTSPASVSAASVSPTTIAPAWVAELQSVLAAQQQALDTLMDRTGGRRGGDGEWEPVDGVLTRWARRAIAGERVMLILDELARGHRSVVSTVMTILNAHERATIAAQGLAVPAGSESAPSFHLLDVWTTGERLVIPSDRVVIVATANVGGRYNGLTLDDPAFQRRWDSWMELGAYAVPATIRILSRHLALDGRSPLIGALNAVAAKVAEYEERTARLGVTLDLATLIAWGSTTLASIRHGDAVGTAFATAARDVWIERLVPRKGSALDPDVEHELVRMVHDHTPRTIA